MKKNQLIKVLLVGLVILAGIIVFAWWVMGFVPPNWARLWALAATAALPLATWAGWWFGNTEARGKLAGFDNAIDRMFGGLTKASGLGAKHTEQTRQIQSPSVVILPDVEITQRRLNGPDVIDL